MNDTDSNVTRDTMPHDTARDVVPVPEAAVALGITDDAVRARLRRGSLAGEKRGGTWFVDREALIAVLRDDAIRHDAARARDTTPHDAPERGTRRDVTPAVDLAPLAEVVREQARRIEELSAAAAMWQARAIHLDEQMRHLTVGVESAPEAVDATEGDETGDQVAPHRRDENASQEGAWRRLRRWWRG